MSHYRRANTAGATYFFTVVSYRRQTILCDELIRHALRDAIAEVRTRRPFSVDARVLLPDHLHCIWTLPPDDADFAARWSLVKRRVSVACGERYRRAEWLTPSKRKHRGRHCGNAATGNTSFGQKLITRDLSIIFITIRSSMACAARRKHGRISHFTDTQTRESTRSIGVRVRPGSKEIMVNESAWALRAHPTWLAFPKTPQPSSPAR